MTTCRDCGLSVVYNRNRCQPCTTLRERDISVKPIDEDDLELVLAWRSNPKIYQHSRQQDEPLKWDDHIKWFKSRDSDRYDFIINFDSRRVGVISLSADDEVSVYIGDFSARGHGVATAAVEWLCDRLENRTPIYAEIHRDNEASKRLFGRCGFKCQGQDGEWLQYVYEA